MRCGTRSSSSRTASCWRSRRSWPRSSPRATSRSRRRSRSALARLVALGAVAPALLLLADGVDQLAILALVVRLPPPLHLALDRGALALAVLFGGLGHPPDRSRSHPGPPAGASRASGIAGCSAALEARSAHARRPSSARCRTSASPPCPGT